jgi:hypothetical protein
MTYRGHVKNGVVVLDEPAAIPDGSEVEVRPIKAAEGRRKSAGKLPTLAERLAPFIGVLKGLPPDLAENHDHYLYGVPKRK